MNSADVGQDAPDKSEVHLPDGDRSPDRSPQIPARTLPSTFIRTTSDAIK